MSPGSHLRIHDKPSVELRRGHKCRRQTQSALTRRSLHVRESRVLELARVLSKGQVERDEEYVVLVVRLLHLGLPARRRWARLPAHAPPKTSSKFRGARCRRRHTASREAPRKVAQPHPVVAPLRCQRPVVCMVPYSNTGTIQASRVRARPQANQRRSRAQKPVISDTLARAAFARAA